MPQRLERTARAFSLLLSTAFLLLSILLIAVVCLATINSPKPDISPEPLNSYPQYIVTILLIGTYSCCLFCLNAFGFIALCLPGSFLMSIHIIGQIAMISAQLIAVAFTITVRKRLHKKLEDAWRDRPGCVRDADCLPVRRFMHSEALLIITLCVFLCLQETCVNLFILVVTGTTIGIQWWSFFSNYRFYRFFWVWPPPRVILLLTSTVVCEKRSYAERQAVLKEHDEDDDDDD